MSLPEQIKEVFRRFALRRAYPAGRKKKLVNLSKASNIGILFEVPDDRTYQQVHDYILKLQEKKIRIKAIGFVKEKHLSAHFLPILSFDFIYARDVNWFGKPVSKRVQDFWSSDFDICINIGSAQCYPLKYILARSVSPLKVGPFTENDKELYDIMIKPDDHHDQVKFLHQVHEYLSILNPRENA